MGAKNRVIAGDYKDKGVSMIGGELKVLTTFTKSVNLSKHTVDKYELITDEHRKSAVSGITRGAVGAALLGPIGVLAGLSAKNKGVYTIAIQFKDGKNSLIEINDNLYNQLIKIMF